MVAPPGYERTPLVFNYQLCLQICPAIGEDRLGREDYDREPKRGGRGSPHTASDRRRCASTVARPGIRLRQQSLVQAGKSETYRFKLGRRRMLLRKREQLWCNI